MPAFMPLLIFLPMFVAIGFMIANQRRFPQPPPTAGERRRRIVYASIAIAAVLLIAVVALAFINHRPGSSPS